MLVKSGHDIILPYLEDTSGLVGGHAEAVYIPENEKELSEFLRDASARRLPVTISGAGTGVAGGRVPMGGAVVSLERFTAINPVSALTKNDAVVTAGAGAFLQDVKSAAQNAGYLYAPDPTEQNSTIGGNIATNASGSRGFAYGPTRRYIRRLKLVLANGEILDIRRGERFARADGTIELPSRSIPRLKLPSYALPDIKNAAAYFNYPGMDLIDLFIGHEGTLGIVTEAELALVPPVVKMLAGIAFFRSRENALAFVDRAREDSSQPGEGAVRAMALEYMDRYALGLLREDFPQVPKDAEAAVIFEQDTTHSDEQEATGRWLKMLERFETNPEDVWFSASPREIQSFREFRHRLPEKINHIVKLSGLSKVGTDIAVPRGRFVEMMHFYDSEFAASGLQFLVFGHIGECHLHANILPRSRAEYESARELYVRLANKAVSLGGTVSAEHGIGKLKHIFLERMIGEGGMKELARFKKSIDNTCILSPGNVFPAPMLSTR